MENKLLKVNISPLNEGQELNYSEHREMAAWAIVGRARYLCDGLKKLLPQGDFTVRITPQDARNTVTTDGSEIFSTEGAVVGALTPQRLFEVLTTIRDAPPAGNNIRVIGLLARHVAKQELPEDNYYSAVKFGAARMLETDRANYVLESVYLVAPNQYKTRWRSAAQQSVLVHPDGAIVE